MSIYQPKSIKELYYNTGPAEKLKGFVVACQPVLLYGGPGVGKSSSVYAVANELDYSVQEVNGSDARGKEKMAALLDRCNMNTLRDKEVIYFIDEVDGISAWSPVEELLVRSRHPVVLAANEVWKIPDNVKNRCNQLKYDDPPLGAVSNLVRDMSTKLGVKPHYELLTKGVDFRSGLLLGIYGGSRQQTSDPFKDTENLVRNGVVPAAPNPQLTLYLMDNASTFFYGSKLVEYELVLAQVDLIKRSSLISRELIMSQFRAMRSGRVLYPHYLKRIGILRRSKKK
jgi:SpoVK/Ycf46/Vps4 family AAA+-type ATPase